jgi:hypothetical protein
MITMRAVRNPSSGKHDNLAVCICRSSLRQHLFSGADLNAEIDKAMPTRDEAAHTAARPKKIGPAAEQASTDSAIR